ncbi:transmembrane protein 154 isoform X6 [Tachysurus fulvidraco]|uniref:transmembrane protein 154 isoform X7 n=1 Tax=Tachysurus fulvidraco TaxID=1234273 RepID=UPI001FEE054F|nr:transmembrane protein 154 isoform X7 [Tachysurus fulvidraco]XP_047672551.1 transmembrane protein 154 isoform X6 [Tachysurus fulvidraco]
MTEGWYYGTVSVSALSKGHYCHRGLWEMAHDVLLLILALTACLTEPAHCEEIDGSGVPKTETQSTSISTTITNTPPVTSVTWSSTLTVDVQNGGDSKGAETLAQVTGTQNFDDQDKEDSEDAETLAQVTLTQNSDDQDKEDSEDAETLAQVTLTQNSMRNNTSPDNTTTDKKHKSASESSESHTTGEKHDVEGQNNSTQDEDETDIQDTGMTFPIIAACLTIILILVVAAVGLVIVCRRRKRNTADPEKDDPYLNDDFGEKVPMPMFEDDMPSVMELEMEDLEKWMIKRGSDISVESK